jgi:ankyrin repeat protein
VVLTSTDLIAPGSQTPLDRLLTRVSEVLGEPANYPPDVDAVTAVDLLLPALNRSLARGGTDSETRLVIGLDQFEEIVDYRVSRTHSEVLTSLFQFIPEGCSSGRIGFIYTCQSNRVELLNADPELVAVVEHAHSKSVAAVTPESVRDIASNAFATVGVRLSEPLIGALQQRVGEFSRKAFQASVEGENPLDAQATLLPLLSLTLLRLARYCQQRKERLQPRWAGRSVAPAAWLLDAPAAQFGPSDPAEAAETSEPRPAEPLDDGVLHVALEELPKGLLDIEGAIAEHADLAVNEARNLPGVNWSDDLVDGLLRRLVRVEGVEGRHSLPAAIPPQRGAAKLLAQKLREHRLLIPVDRERVRLVHQSVVTHWPPARTWIEKESELLAASRTLYTLAQRWQAGGRPESALAVGPQYVDDAGRLLWAWNGVFTSNDGNVPGPEDTLLREFALAVLASAATPERTIVTPAGKSGNHFLVAAFYARADMLRAYLARNPELAVESRTGEGENAAYVAAYAGDLESLDLVLARGADPGLVSKRDWLPVHVAAHSGSVGVVDRLVAAGADVHARGPYGTTALHQVASEDDLEMARHLVERYGADVNAVDDSNMTPLANACRFAASRVAEYLLSCEGIDVTTKSSDGWSIFQLACRFSDATVVKRLLSKAATDPEASVNDWSPLHLAMHRGSADMVRALVQDPRVDRTTDTPNHKSPLELAIELMGAEGAAALLSDPFHKVLPNAVPEKRDPPLVAACRSGNVYLVRVLVDGGAGVDYNYGQPLTVAAERGDVAVLRLLLPRATLAPKRVAETTALHSAARNGHAAAVRELLSHTPREWHERRDVRGQTALHLAASRGHVETVEALLQAIAPTLTDFAGDTALHVAAESNRIATARALVKKDPRLLARADALGRAYCHVAAAHGNTSLLASEIDPAFATRRDAQGMLPLHHAARFGRTETVARLLEEPVVDPNAEDRFGWTPLHMAAQAGNLDVAERLIARGASRVATGGEPAMLPYLVAGGGAECTVRYGPGAAGPRRGRHWPRQEHRRRLCHSLGCVCGRHSGLRPATRARPSPARSKHPARLESPGAGHADSRYTTDAGASRKTTGGLRLERGRRLFQNLARADGLHARFQAPLHQCRRDRSGGARLVCRLAAAADQRRQLGE